MKTSPQLEEEANVFACLLLMPKEFIAKDVNEGLDLSDDNNLIKLSKKYKVPLTALCFRIGLYINRGI